MTRSLLQGPWCGVAETITREMTDSTAYTARLLVSALCADPDVLTAQQRSAVGQAARRLLNFAWARTPRDTWLVTLSLEAVCRTYESDTAASRELLLRALVPEHVSKFGYEELPRLTAELRRVVLYDPAFAAEVYIAVFSYAEKSDEKTDMGHSRILSLSSNRRQDYGMAEHHLERHYGDFFMKAPEVATRALLGILEAYVPREHPHGFSAEREEILDIGGAQIKLLSDCSSIWDDHTYRQIHDELKILDSFQAGLEGLACTAANEALPRVIDCIKTRNRLAILWRRVFLAAAKHPDSLGRLVLPIAASRPFLLCSDTHRPSAEFLAAAFPTLSREARSSIEAEILRLPEAYQADRRIRGEKLRDSLLLQLPPEHLTSREAQERAEQLHSSGSKADNSQHSGVHWSEHAVTEEEDLAERGVPVDAEPNRTLRSLTAPVAAFVSRHESVAPTSEELRAAVGSLRTLLSAIRTADADGAHPEQRDRACGRLADACEFIAQKNNLEPDILEFVRSALLIASHSPAPAKDTKAEEQFDEHPSWGGYSPRVNAAEGLMWLSRKPEYCSPELLTAVERLSGDPVAAVRFQIARRLNGLFYSAPDLMWQLAAQIADHETSRGVLRGFLSDPIGVLAGTDPDRATAIILRILDGVLDGPGAEDTRAKGYRIFGQLYLYKNHAPSREQVLRLADNPAADPVTMRHVLLDTRDLLARGPVSPADTEQDAVRGRAILLFDRVLAGAFASIQALERTHAGKPFETWPEDHQETARDLARLVDSCGDEIYFASGAYASKRGAGGKEEDKVPPEAMHRFYQEAGHLIDRLADSGFASVTHHLLETLEAFIQFDPRGVFLRIGRVVIAGARGGYQFEKLGADLLVSIVERYLAEHRMLFREDETCRAALIAALDLFVRAGWPSARSLTYRLSDIYR